jgi:hypothetical protein
MDEQTLHQLIQGNEDHKDTKNGRWQPISLENEI